MLSVRKLGKSVDGRLDNTYHRPKRYRVYSLEQDGVKKGEHTFPFQDILPDPVRVEAYVVAKLTLLEIISSLEPEERRYIFLLCQGFKPQEVAAQVQRPYAAVKQGLARMRKKLIPIR
jgi:DNA-directed RNA polymerase specialized sigma24 family protein